VKATVHRYPLKDMGITKPEQIRKILDTIRSSIEAGHPVYLHCWGGHGRTGTIVG
jgi:protein-tyrosine phosphatase